MSDFLSAIGLLFFFGIIACKPDLIDSIQAFVDSHPIMATIFTLIGLFFYLKFNRCNYE